MKINEFRANPGNNNVYNASGVAAVNTPLKWSNAVAEGTRMYFNEKGPCGSSSKSVITQIDARVDNRASYQGFSTISTAWKTGL